MSLRPGTHEVGPGDGTLLVRTYREGVAQRVGHDLVLEVERWEATVDVAKEGAVTAVRLEADAASLAVREGLHGVKPLSDRDRAEIRRTIDQKVLQRRPIAFRSARVSNEAGRLSVSGDLTMAGGTRPLSVELELSEDGRLRGTLPVAQSDWGIRPYRGFLGALKVRDAVEVVVDAQL